MPTPTYNQIATITLATSSPQMIFDLIPQTYRDLVLIMSTSLTSSATVVFQVNNDTTSANYPNVWMRGDGSSPASGTGLLSGGRLSTVNYSAGPAQTAVNFMDYSLTDKHKTILVRHGLASAESFACANRWTNTAVINSIAVICAGSTFTTGSTFSLYGVIG
jgi:hypothetical protein